MSDPITASIEIGISAIKAGAAIATWWEVRQSNKRNGGPGASSGTGASLDEIFLVFSSLGQRLMALDVVNYDALPQALAAVKVAVETSDDDLAYELGRLDPILQYLVACAFVFCAACHPMSIYYGYGCGVMNDTRWANPEHRSAWNMDIDQAIAYLKSVPHPWKLLKKSPSQIGKTEPFYEQCEKKTMKLVQGIQADLFKQFEKHGYPQPLPPNDTSKSALGGCHSQPMAARLYTQTTAITFQQQLLGNKTRAVSYTPGPLASTRIFDLGRPFCCPRITSQPWQFGSRG